MSKHKSELALLGESSKRITKLERAARNFIEELIDTDMTGDELVEQASVALQVVNRIAELSPEGLAFVRKELDAPTSGELERAMRGAAIPENVDGTLPA